MQKKKLEELVEFSILEFTKRTICAVLGKGEKLVKWKGDTHRVN